MHSTKNWYASPSFITLKVSIVVKDDAILLNGKYGEYKLPVSLFFLYNHYQDIISALLLEEIYPGLFAIETESDKYPDAALIFPLSKYRISSASSGRKIKPDFKFADLFGLPNEKISEDPIEIANENPNVRYHPYLGEDEESDHGSGTGTGYDGSGQGSDGEVSGSKIDESSIIQLPFEPPTNEEPIDKKKPEDAQGEGNSNPGKIAAIAIGCVIMIAVIVAVVIFVIIFIRKRSKEASNAITSDDAEAKSANGAEDIEP